MSANANMLLLLLVLCSWALARAADVYTTKYEDVNVEEILGNDRLYRKYFHCLTGERKCTPDGQELKERLPEALATGCKRCTPRQKAESERVLRYLIERRPDDWAVLERIFDPVGEYRKRYRDEVLRRGIRFELVDVVPVNGTAAEGEKKEGEKKEGESTGTPISNKAGTRR